MRATASSLAGVVILDLDLIEDERGFFARTYCEDELTRLGMSLSIAQSSVSFNHRRGTLRGMHWQAAPGAESKLVRCTQGAVFDVIVDLRPDSATYCRWTSVELTAANRRQVFIPEGCAHGFLTLEDATEVSYQISTAYRPELSRGARWDDPTFAIAWPFLPTVMSERDRTHPPFAGAG